MKLVNSLFFGLCVLGLAATAEAQTVVRLTGSTAYRSQTHAAIQAIMTGEVFAYQGGTLNSANRSIFSGTVNGNPVIFKCSWSGAVAGTRDLTQQNLLEFYADSTPMSGGGTANTPAGNLVANEGAADIAMYDQFQTSTVFTQPDTVDTIVGIIAFKWMASPGFPVTNFTTQQAITLAQAGELPLSFFTGNVGDQASKVYFTGRDPFSGTRLVSFAESGIGIFSNVIQYSPTVSGATITAIAPYAPGGNGGVSSGGTLAQHLRKTFTGAVNGGNGAHFITYMGISDAAVALGVADANGSPATELAWNGETYSEAKVQQGKYTFWSYQQLAYLPSLSGTKLDVADTLKAAIIAADTTLAGMQVTRPTDGGFVSPTF